MNNSNPNTVTDNYEIAKNVMTSYVNKEHDKITHKMNNFFFQPSSLKDSGEVQGHHGGLSPQPMRRDLKTADGTKKLAHMQNANYKRVTQPIAQQPTIGTHTQKNIVSRGGQAIEQMKLGGINKTEGSSENLMNPNMMQTVFSGPMTPTSHPESANFRPKILMSDGNEKKPSISNEAVLLNNHGN